MKCHNKNIAAIIILVFLTISSNFAAAQGLDPVPQNARLAKTYYNEGIKFLNLGSLNKALSNFTISLSNNPLYVPAHAGLQDVFIEKGKEDSIRAIYDGYVDMNPDNPAYIYLAARLFDPEIAEVEYQRVISFDSLFYWGHVGLGQTYNTIGMFAEAVFYCSTAVAINPVIPDAQIALGVAYENLGELDKAQIQYEKALIINPSVSPEAYLNLGMLYLEKADTTNSINNLDLYLNLVTRGSEADFARVQVDSMKAALLRAQVLREIKN